MRVLYDETVFRDKVFIKLSFLCSGGFTYSLFISEVRVKSVRVSRNDRINLFTYPSSDNIPYYGNITKYFNNVSITQIFEKICYTFPCGTFSLFHVSLANNNVQQQNLIFYFQ